MKLPGVISLRKDRPICAIPNGSLRRIEVATLSNWTNIACAVSGRRYAIDDDSATGPTCVANMRLNWRASVSVPRLPQLGQAISDGGPFRSSSRKRSLQLRQSTIGSLKPATCPEASHTRGFMMIAASMPTTSSRRVTMCRHQAALMLFLSSTPSGP